MDSLWLRLKSCSPWALLPPLFSAGVAVGLTVVYFMALADGKILPLMSEYRPDQSALPPYISVAGNSPPASCVFSQTMNLGAFTGGLIAVFRHHQLKNTGYKPWLNAVSLLLLSCGCFGMTLIGNFQLFVEEEIHNMGTFLTFGLGTVFCWIQSFVTLRVNLHQEGLRTSILRFLLSAAITTCFILYSVLMSQSLHGHAARAQWALVLFLLLFIGTFTVEFRHSRLSVTVTDNSATLSLAPGGPECLDPEHLDLNTGTESLDPSNTL